VELARVYLGQLRQPDNALPYAERAYKVAPEELGTIAALVDVCAAGRLTQRIEETLRKTLTLSQKDAAFWLRAGDLFRSALMLRGGPPPKYQLDRLNNLYKKALDLQPADVDCVERAADHYSLTQQYAEACRFFERANTLFRQNNKGSSLQIGYKWSRALVLNEQIDAAIELLEELVREHTQSAEAREFLGELHLSQGQLVPALAHFRWALDLDGSKLGDHVRLIQLELRLKRPEDAVEAARKAKAQFTDAPGLTMLLAVALGEAKRHNEALEAFASAEQEFLKNQAQALDASFYLTYGAAAERAGLLDQAAVLLKKSISLDPENAAEALNYLGFMWVDRNTNLEEAGTLIRKALGLRPNYPAYLDSLGWWHYRKGDLAGAARELRRALERIRREEAPEVYDHLGEVMLQSGRPEEAVNAWEAALELDPSLEEIRAKIDAVRKVPEKN
jgi:tetratricopeptide (TPR) repeat protein